MGIAHRPVGKAEIAERLPMLNLDGVTEAFEAAGAGMLFASRVVTALARWLQEAGVELHPNTRVTDLDPESGTFRAAGTRHKAGTVVVAAEADVAGVFTAARENFAGFDGYRVLEQKICYYTVIDDERFVVEPIGKSGWLLSACSGHGFKLGSLIATGLADVLAGRRAARDLPSWAAGLSPTPTAETIA